MPCRAPSGAALFPQRLQWLPQPPFARQVHLYNCWETYWLGPSVHSWHLVRGFLLANYFALKGEQEINLDGAAAPGTERSVEETS